MPYSRFDLFEPLRALGRFTANQRSENEDRSPVLHTADLVVEHGVEFLGILLAISTALEMGRDKLVTVDVHPRETLGQTPEGPHLDQELAVLIEQLPREVTALSQLNAAWRQAYHKSRQETYYVYEDECTGVGDERKCHSVLKQKQKTVWYWDEPQQLTAQGLNHNSIEYWLNEAKHQLTRLTYLKTLAPQAPTFKFRMESYTFNVVPMDQEGQNLTRTIGFGTGAFAFAIYEEIITMLENQGLDLRKAEGLSQRGMKRRSFLKLAGLLGLGQALGLIQDGVAEQNSHLLQDIQTQTAALLQQKDVEPDQAFSRFMQRTVDQVVQPHDVIARASLLGLEYGSASVEDWASIQPHLQSVRTEATHSGSLLKETLGYLAPHEHHLPEQLPTAMNATWVHEHVLSFSRAKGREAESAALTELMVLIGGLTGLALTNELIVQATDAVLDRVAR